MTASVHYVPNCCTRAQVAQAASPPRASEAVDSQRIATLSRPRPKALR
jgi:hypothetical protein